MLLRKLLTNVFYLQWYSWKYACKRAKQLHSCLTVCNSVNCSCQAPLSMRFSRQEYQSGLPCRPQGIFLTPAIKPESLTSPALAGGSLPLASPGKPLMESIKPLGQIALWDSQQPNHVSKEGPFPKRQGTSEHLRDLKKNSHKNIC